MRSTESGRERSGDIGCDGPALLADLERFYGALPMPPDDPFRLYVWEVLSMQTSAPRRDAALAALQRLRALTPDAMWRLAPGPLEAAVRLAGPYVPQRLAALRGGVAQFRRRPALTTELRQPLWRATRSAAVLPRLGPGTVYRLLLFAGGHFVQPVDPEVGRVWTRLLGVPEPARIHPRHVRRGLEAMMPREVGLFRRLAVYLRHHAGQTCTTDPHCSVCPLRSGCRGAVVGRQEYRVVRGTK